MEPHRQPAGRRVLLPAEVDLCEAVGLSEEEYWYFVEAADRYNGERSEAYALIPDIRCEPATTTAILVSIGLSLVSTAAALLLAPKPQSPEKRKDPRRLSLGGQTGPTRFSPTSSFDSTQELARLGETIPLVFAKKGVRVNSSLLWSQIIAEARGQQMRALFLFSHGPTEGRPDYEGLAIGDTLLRSYTAPKVAAYWMPTGGRPVEPNDRFPESLARNLPNGDAFATIWDTASPRDYYPYFVGARTPTTQTAFGAYAPSYNGTWYRPQYELVLIPDEADGDFKRDLQKRKDLRGGSAGDPTVFTQRTFFDVVRNPDNPGGLVGHGANPNACGAVVPGSDTGFYDEIRYRITTGLEDVENSNFQPERLDFVNSATTSSRLSADSNIALGELYLVGDTVLAVCTKIYSSDVNDVYKPWSAKPPVDKNAWFSVTTPGCVQCPTLDTAINNPLAPWLAYPLMRAAVATITNTRPCTATELVIKSRVWRQVSGFPDMNAHPGKGLIEDYEDEGGSISLGTLNKYLRRLSFFMLETRPVDGDGNWIDLTGNEYFFVEGNKPIDQYNYIRINHEFDEHEFRLRPVSGVGALRKFGANGQAVFRRLRYGIEGTFSAHGRLVFYSGEEVVINKEYTANPEFIRPASTSQEGGALDNGGISPVEAGTFVQASFGDWESSPFDSRYNRSVPKNFVTKRITQATGRTVYEYYWDDRIIASGVLPGIGAEPPEVFVGDYRFTWAVNSSDDNVVVSGGTMRAFRQINAFRREQVPASSAVDAVSTEAIPVRTQGSGLRFWVERYLGPNSEIGYKWYIDENNRGSGYQPGDFVEVKWEDGSVIHGVNIVSTTEITLIDEEEQNYAPYDAALDVLSYDSQNASNVDGPEHQVVAVNEKLAQSTPFYEGLVIGGLRLDSSSEWQQFTNFSAFIKKGIVLENLATGNNIEASNLLPDIVYGMMTNPVWGAGETIGPYQVDKESMAIASKFCSANDFTWDGVVDNKVNFREWVFENAQYNLLDATVVGGRFALIPAVPYTTDFKIGNNVKPAIKALFTDGNMRNMQVEFLSPQDRQLFRATINWREDKENGFPTTRQFSVRMADSQGGAENDPEERFDLSGFCTSQDHATQYAMYALTSRKYIDHVITFQTTPQAAMGMAPGDYFRVSSNSTHTSRFNNGSVNPDGVINSVDTLSDGTYSIYYWRPNTEEVQEAQMVVSGGKAADPALYGIVFTVTTQTNETRVYKLESLTYGEDGLIDVAGSHSPVTDAGTLAVLDWNPDYFFFAGT